MAKILIEKELPTQTASEAVEQYPLAIKLIDLCKFFGTRKHRIQAIDHLSLEIRQGEIFGLLGPNGSGKTTLINMLSGLDTPTSGTITIMGLDVRRQARAVRRLLGVVPQETGLYEELPALANLEFHADLFGVPRRDKAARIQQILELVQLADRKAARVATFSGGMKRRLALGRALLHEPRLLYLDEPTLGVDVQSRNALWAYIRTLREQGKTVLLTTNYLEEAAALCDRIAIIDHGRLVVVDTPARLKERYGLTMIELELEAGQLDADLSAAIERLPGVESVTCDAPLVTIAAKSASTLLPSVLALLGEKQGPVISRVAIREPHLDEIFLSLTGAALRD